MEQKKPTTRRPFRTFIKRCRSLHRHLSYLFAGVVIVYALSGILMNHRDTLNPHYTAKRIELSQALPNAPLAPEQVSKSLLLPLLEEIGEKGNYTKHYSPDPSTVKVFLKGGSSLEIDLRSGDATYDRLRRRPMLSQMVTLHYNPGRWWTHFSDCFALALVIITLTGLFIAPGKKGLKGIGGIELIVGILVPLLFLWL